MNVSLGDRYIAPPVLLAPMAGITDLPFRTLVSRFGAVLVVSEMIASGEFLTARPGTREKAELGADIANTSVQIAGRAAEPMAEASAWSSVVVSVCPCAVTVVTLWQFAARVVAPASAAPYSAAANA